MPELPEVETVRTGLEHALVGARLSHAHVLGKLREPIDANTLESFCRNRVVTAVRRRAKYLLVVFQEGDGLILHLGMTGSFKLDKALPPYEKHVQVLWDLEDGRVWRFIDIRRFGLLRICHECCRDADPACLGKLGTEPLSDDFDKNLLYKLIGGHHKSIKEYLLDQTQIAGIGNIYASESLFRARIHPQRQACSLTLPECDRLVQGIKSVLLESITAGGTTISDFRTLDGKEGGFNVHLEVYGRDGAPCLDCGTGIRHLVQGGRSTFYCPRCQKMRSKTPIH